jgi:hypothetical protein
MLADDGAQGLTDMAVTEVERLRSSFVGALRYRRPEFSHNTSQPVPISRLKQGCPSSGGRSEISRHFSNLLDHHQGASDGNDLPGTTLNQPAHHGGDSVDWVC